MENKEYAKECGLRLRRVRMAKNMSQQDLADKMFTTPQNVSKWEKEGIRDIDTIKNLSQILGQDLLSDERNEEGIVGEIGKHILKKIAENSGFLPVTALIEEHMFGLKSETVTEEIFKLQKIGMCVREQYKNFYDEEKDMLFITAKGVITLNNLLVFGSVQCKTYEQFLENRSTIQQYYDENKVERLIRNLHYCGTYRIDYINYLHKRYEDIYIDETENDGCYIDDWTAAMPVLLGKSFRIDLLFRMIAGLDDTNLRGAAEDLLCNTYDYDDNEPSNSEMFEWKYGDEEIPYIDRELSEKSAKISDWNEKLNSQINFKIKEQAEDDCYTDLYVAARNFMEGNVDYFIDQNIESKKLLDISGLCSRKGVCCNLNYFVEGKYPSEWFSIEEIKTFIKENFRSSETSKEQELDGILAEINTLDPSSLKYYDCSIAPSCDYSTLYFCDNKWKEAGIEKMIKSFYNLNTDDESEADE